MTGFEERLRIRLEQEAAEVTAERGRLPRVVRDVRRRRMLRGAAVSLAGCVAFAGALVGVGLALDEPKRRTDRVAGQPPDEGAYPTIASGTFRGRAWTLVVIEDPDAAHPEDTESDAPEIEFQIEGPEPNAGSFETFDSWEVVSAPFHTSIHGGHEIVMGMVDEAVDSVIVDAGGGWIAATVVDGSAAPLPGTNYYLAFVPAGTKGELIAQRDGAEVGTVPLPGVPESPDVSFECASDHRADASSESYPLLGSGTFEGRTWTLRMVEDPDAAHPEDDESDRPEVLFEIDGDPPGGGSFETHERWDVIEASLHSRVGGTEYVLGTASSQVASVTFERDRGDDETEATMVPAGASGPPAAHYYVVFFPRGAFGEIVARDEAGDVIGRASVDVLLRPEVCPGD